MPNKNELLLQFPKKATEVEPNLKDPSPLLHEGLGEGSYRDVYQAGNLLLTLR